MASPWNQHCANCTGTLSFAIPAVTAAKLMLDLASPAG